VAPRPGPSTHLYREPSLHGRGFDPCVQLDVQGLIPAGGGC